PAARTADGRSAWRGRPRSKDAAVQPSEAAFFLSHSRSLLSQPICSYNLAWRASASAAPTLAPLANTVSAPASSCFFQPWIRVGWTPKWLANSLTVRSPLAAARATWALNAAVCCFRLTRIVTPFLGHQSSLAGGPVFGVHYTPPTQPSSEWTWRWVKRERQAC